MLDKILQTFHLADGPLSVHIRGYMIKYSFDT